MHKRLLPTYYASSIYDIDISFYKKIGVRYILSDLDNTLDSIVTKEPSEKAIDLVKRLKEAGITFIIISNNTSSRVQKYSRLLGIEAACLMRKPLSGPLKKYLNNHGIDNKEAVMIGDQLLTDIPAGNGAGVKTILTSPLTKIDPPWTKVNRVLERKNRRKIIREHLCLDWREVE